MSFEDKLSNEEIAKLARECDQRIEAIVKEYITYSSPALLAAIAGGCIAESIAILQGVFRLNRNEIRERINDLIDTATHLESN